MADDEPAAHPEPVFEGEAVELPADPAAAGRQPLTEIPFPVAGEPIAVASSGLGPDPVTTLGDSAEAFASGHAATAGPPWQEPLMEYAQERPEVVVAAAFAGGLLAAMILRRLGS